MDGEVVHTLLTLFDEGILVDFPREVLHAAVHLFQGLVYGDGTHGYGAVADNPFAGFVDVGTGGEVHQRVATPLAAPGGLLHLLFDARGGGGIADVGIDFHQEVAANDHGLGLGMVDVGRQHGTSAGDFAAYEFRGDVALDAQFPAVHVLANGHILHFGGDDSCLGIGHLRDVPAGLGTSRKLYMLETQGIERMVVQPHLAVFAAHLRELLGVVALQNPGFAQAGQTFLEVHLDVRVGKRTAGVVNQHRGVLLHVGNAVLVLGDGGRKVHLRHSYPEEGEYLARHIVFFALGVSLVVVGHRFGC